MTKEKFLGRLREELTFWLPEAELEDIIRYYSEYFEEAGPEREQEVLRELGTPEHLAQTILGTVAGAPEAPDPGVSIEYEYDHAWPAGQSEREAPPAGSGPLPEWAFILIAAVLGCICLPGVAGLVIGLGAAGIACIAAGAAVAMGGIFGVNGLPGLLCLLGAGLAVTAVGMFLIFAGASIGKGVADLCKRLGGRLWRKYVLGVGEEGSYEAG